MLLTLEKTFKLLFAASLLACAVLYFFKDELPPASFYDLAQLGDPIQEPTLAENFNTEVNGENYLILPKYDYELEGVIVSYNNSGDFTDYFHSYWNDYINLRDLCVVWGSNVETGVYLDMDFHNDSWTCWARWPSREVGKIFDKDKISNNHVLIDDNEVENRLMQSEPGDHIRLKGVLAEYHNPRTGFRRSTSTIRTDTGNGACETIYVTDFELVKKANPRLRMLFAIAKWSAILSAIGIAWMFVFAPYRGRYTSGG